MKVTSNYNSPLTMERSRSNLDVISETRLAVQRLTEQVQHPIRYSTFDDWHIVGNSGEPIFAGTWVNFDQAVVEERAAFWKDSAGIVRLRGIVKSGTTTIFTLPVGFRPVGVRRFVVAGDNAFARVNVNTDGTVAQLAGTAATFLTLDAIMFRAEA